MTQQTAAFHQDWFAHSEEQRTPLRSAISARFRQEPLGPHRASSDPDSRPDGFEPSPTTDASGQLVHPTLSKTSTRTPRGYRLARGSSMRPVASRRWPRSGWLSRRGSDAVDARLARCRGPTCDVRVTSCVFRPRGRLPLLANAASTTVS